MSVLEEGVWSQFVIILLIISHQNPSLPVECHSSQLANMDFVGERITIITTPI